MNHIGKALRVAWVALCFCILIFSISAYDGKPSWEGEVLQIYAMILLSFPAGLAVAHLYSAAFAFLYHQFGVAIYVSRAYLFLTWAGFFLVGYAQWFVLLPYVRFRISALAARSGSASDA
jgi:hypothetical protein